MTRKRTKAAANAEAPITGVAAGGLGTAANLDDTQVLRTADLEAAAPGWLEEDPPAPAEAAARVEPVVASPPRTKAHPSPGAAGAMVSAWRRRSPPALAGVAALAVLLLIAGSGFVSQLDFGIGSGPAGAASEGALIEAAPSPTAEPKEAGKEGNGKCHGKGRGNHCGGD